MVELRNEEAFPGQTSKYAAMKVVDFGTKEHSKYRDTGSKRERELYIMQKSLNSLQYLNRNPNLNDICSSLLGLKE